MDDRDLHEVRMRFAALLVAYRRLKNYIKLYSEGGQQYDGFGIELSETEKGRLHSEIGRLLAAIRIGADRLAEPTGATGHVLEQIAKPHWKSPDATEDLISNKLQILNQVLSGLEPNLVEDGESRILFGEQTAQEVADMSATLAAITKFGADFEIYNCRAWANLV